MDTVRNLEVHEIKHAKKSVVKCGCGQYITKIDEHRAVCEAKKSLAHQEWRVACKIHKTR